MEDSGYSRYSAYSGTSGIRKYFSGHLISCVCSSNPARRSPAIARVMSLRAGVVFVALIQLLVTACAGVSSDRADERDAGAMKADQSLVSYHRGLATEVLGQLQAGNLLYEDREARLIVDRVLAKLLPDTVNSGINVVFTSLPGENALALANGTILIHQSLLATVASESQLAFLLAHEIAHVNLSHAWSTTRSSMQARFDRHAFGREQEMEADRYAAKLLVQAGFDLVDASEFFIQLGNYPVAYPGPEQTRTHPLLIERKRALLKAGRFTLAANYKGDDLAKRRKTKGLSERQLNRQFDHFRIRQLVRSIQTKTIEPDLPGALVQLADLENITGSGDQTECLRADIYAAIGADFAAARSAMSELLTDNSKQGTVRQQGGQLPPALQANGFFQDQAEALYRGILAQSPDTNCAVRGLSNLLAQR